MARTKRKRALVNALYLALKSLKIDIEKRSVCDYLEPIPVTDLNSRKVIDAVILSILNQDLGRYRNKERVESYHSVCINNIMKIFKTPGYDDSLIPLAWDLIIIEEVHRS